MGRGGSVAFDHAFDHAYLYTTQRKLWFRDVHNEGIDPLPSCPKMDSNIILQLCTYVAIPYYNVIQ